MRAVYETKDFWVKMDVQKCKVDHLKEQLKLSIISIKESVVLGVESVGMHLERAGGVVYLHRCAKREVIVIKNTFCTEEVPVRLYRDGDSVIRYMHLISSFLY